MLAGLAAFSAWTWWWLFFYLDVVEFNAPLEFWTPHVFLLLWPILFVLCVVSAWCGCDGVSRFSSAFGAVLMVMALVFTATDKIGFDIQFFLMGFEALTAFGLTLLAFFMPGVERR